MVRARWRWVVSLFVLALLTGPVVPVQGAEGGVRLVVDGRELISDPPAQIVEGRTLVPLRFVAEALGVQVQYDAAGPGVVMVHPRLGRFYLSLSRPTVTLPDGSTRQVDPPAQIIASRTFVPLRFIAEAFGARVNWDGASRTVSIATAAPAAGPTPPAGPGGHQPPGGSTGTAPTPGTAPGGGSTGSDTAPTPDTATDAGSTGSGTAPAVAATWGPEVKASGASTQAGGAVGRTLAIDAQGHLHAVWTDTVGKALRVCYARSTDGGATWTPGRDLAGNRLPAFAPNIAAGPDGSLHVVWADRRNGTAHVYYISSPDGGDTWQGLQDLSPNAAHDVAGAGVSVDSSGRVHVAWHEGSTEATDYATTVYYARSTDGGDHFSTPVRLNSGDGHAAWARFSVEGSSGDLLAIAWRDNRRQRDWDIYVAISSDDGASFVEQAARAGADREWDPDVAVDRGGVIHLSYMVYGAGGIRIDYQRSADQGQTWSQPQTLSEARSRFPFLALDNEHGVLWAFWKDERDFSSETDIQADVAAKYSSDGGKTWSSLEFATDLGEVEVKYPSPALGPDGRPYLYWSDERAGAGLEAVYVSRRSAPAEGAVE